MASLPHRTRVHSDTYWFILAAIFLAIGIVGTLGEYVFHWWRDPFDWAGPASLALGLLALGWGASGRELRAFRGESGAQHRASQRTLDALAAGQDRLVAGQDRLVEGQERLVAGQREQTEVLREVGASFRGR